MTTRQSLRFVAIAALTCAVLLPLSGSAVSTAPTAGAALNVSQRSPGLPATGGVASPTGLKLEAALADVPAVGNDISWPQCPKGTGIPSRRGQGQPMPPATAQFVVIGLTNGPAFYPNPCLASQTAWAKAHHVYTATYSMTTYPTPSQLATHGSKGPFVGTSSAAKLANTGYAQAQFNVASMRKAGLVSPFMWVDVEPYRVAPWSPNKAGNKAVVDGVLRGYRAAGLKVGVYSTPVLWGAVVGPVRYGLPEWRAAGQRGRATALARCAGPSFQGGRAVLGQWTTPTTDHDLTCPVANTRSVLTAYFHKY